MNEGQNAIVSGIRTFLRFPLIRVPALGALLFVGMGISNGFMFVYADRPMLALILVLMMVALALVVYAGFVKFVEDRPVTELALPRMGSELGMGLALGLGLYSLCILVLSILGLYQIEGLNPGVFILPMIPMAISSGFIEELIYRGVLFRVTEEYLGSWLAIVATSAFFGYRHLGNEDATLLGAIFISVEAGLLLAAAYMVTRRLWLAIGCHMGWNFTQAAIFSGTVSGVEMPPGLVKATIEGPELLTGGKFGVEASVIAFGICTASGLFLLALAMRRGNILQPAWRRRP